MHSSSDRSTAALERLIHVAQGNTGQSRIVANFLLAWWNAGECGGFDLTDVWGVDAPIAVDMLRVFALLAGCHQYPDTMGYGKHLEAIVRGGRPSKQEAGMRTARLDDIVRQKDSALKEAVEQLARGDVRQAIARLDDQGACMISATVPRECRRSRGHTLRNGRGNGGGHARPQLQLGVGDGDHGGIGHDILHHVRRKADLVDGAFKGLRGKGIHGETDFAVGAQLPNIGLVDIGEHLHVGQILRDQEENGRL